MINIKLITLSSFEEWFVNDEINSYYNLKVDYQKIFQKPNHNKLQFKLLFILIKYTKTNYLITLQTVFKLYP